MLCIAGDEQYLQVRAEPACRVRQLTAIHAAGQSDVGYEQVNVRSGLKRSQAIGCVCRRQRVMAELLQHLGFADVREGDIFLTPPARVFAEFGTQERKMMFAEHLLRHVPLAARIKKVLNERPGHRAPRVRFEQELEDFLSDKAAEETLDAVINWGRYGEIFSYNDQTEIFSLEDVES